MKPVRLAAKAGLIACALALSGLALSGLAPPGGALAQGTTPQERFWILWEHIEQVGTDCPGGKNCETRRSYTSRLFEPADREGVYRLFGLLDLHAAKRGQAAEHPEAPRICQHNDPEVMLGFDPERLRLSEKIDALAGLPGVYVNLRGLKAPEGYEGDFGGKLQAAFESRFRNAGIRLLSKEEVERTPGQPKLNVYFSRTNPDTGCWFSVFASLSQTVLLTRDIRTKLVAGTWAMSSGRSASNPDIGEYDAILRVADAFVRDYLKANPGAGGGG
ncbi:hypothetical protein PSA7680_01474 [Pseudoruegeria aquimaris]|uniref:Uncharacterized protein n=1 Tax=Pseudoruegeria aquimaris TaxID=393663 RepID=A0A1Y5S6B9_9RHOB|nr:hypothetical protein [Pseudoruegeria aquimaris]SLN30747.1 hypothetical protein PSA7680_01474 [Pseudoruegeria aquimaris]